MRDAAEWLPSPPFSALAAHKEKLSIERDLLILQVICSKNSRTGCITKLASGIPAACAPFERHEQ
jgi:hypothetical protein